MQVRRRRWEHAPHVDNGESCRLLVVSAYLLHTSCIHLALDMDERRAFVCASSSGLLCFSCLERNTFHECRRRACNMGGELAIVEIESAGN